MKKLMMFVVPMICAGAFWLGIQSGGVPDACAGREYECTSDTVSGKGSSRKERQAEEAAKASLYGYCVMFSGSSSRSCCSEDCVLVFPPDDEDPLYYYECFGNPQIRVLNFDFDS